MSSRRNRLVLGVVLAVSAITTQVAVAAAGNYTIPAWKDPGYSRNYGCVSDTAGAFTGMNADGVSYDCDHFHGGIDYLLSFAPVVSSRGGVVRQVIQSNPNETGTECPPSGNPPANIVVIDHEDGKFSVYLHLTKNGAKVAIGDVVSPGQLIAISGNSGLSCGPHLHYMLTNSQSLLSAPHTYNPNGKWTTANPGRAPWRSDYNSQKAGTAVEGNISVCYGETETYWVKFKNTGGRAWAWANDFYGRTKVALFSTNSSGNGAVASPLQAVDWETSSRISPADTASVAVDTYGVFTFGIEASATQGATYTLYLNLAILNVDENPPGHWEIYDEKARVNVYIIPHQACP